MFFSVIQGRNKILVENDIATPNQNYRLRQPPRSRWNTARPVGEKGTSWNAAGWGSLTKEKIRKVFTYNFVVKKIQWF